MNDLAAAKIKMMKGSIRCLVFGLLALIPVIGLAFGLAALWISGQVRSKEKTLWNPAKPYRICGILCAALGTILWTGVLSIAVVRAIMAAEGLG